MVMKSKMLIHSLVVLFLHHLHLSSLTSASLDTITTADTLSVNQTLVSTLKNYEFGFFPTGADTNKYYLGIWYFNLVPRVVVWVANRDSPPWTPSVSLNVNGSNGGIVLTDHGRSELVLFSSNHSSQATNPVLQLLDTGNLVVREDDVTHTDEYFWQSFDHPTDTLLPGQKLGLYKKTGNNRYLTSWKSTNDPSAGNYSCRLDTTEGPYVFLFKDGVEKITRPGQWVPKQDLGGSSMDFTSTLTTSFVDTPEETCYKFDLGDDDVHTRFKSRIVVDPSGKLKWFAWMPKARSWSVFWYAPMDQCDTYELCGPHGICNSSADVYVCGCPYGFEHRNPAAWSTVGDGSEGCVRRTKLAGDDTDGFVKVGGLKMPESNVTRIYEGKGLEECGDMCRKDGNCTAYNVGDVALTTGMGLCVLRSGDLLDIKTYLLGGQDLYIRLAASDVDECFSSGGDKLDCKSRKSTTKLVIGFGSSIASLLGVIILSGMYQMLKRRNAIKKKKDNFKRNGGLLLQRQMPDSNYTIERTKVFTSNELEKATDNFNKNRVLGYGGQGTVYKGMLEDGTIVAIKKSKKVGERQKKQFINEVVILAQVVHRNVVKLFGCCLETDVPLLVYEYVPNGDLYQHIHNPSEDFHISWKMRLAIAVESAEALAYLHSSSVLPIHHRDVKTSNILLDERYRAKVADFGISKTLLVDQTHVTTGVQGTIGYMDPEFIQSNQYTEKSDVYSFGIVLLELLTSKKPVGSELQDQPMNLASEFLLVMQDSHLHDIVDAQVLEEGEEQEIQMVADLIRRCLNLRGKERPTMKEVAMTLQLIRSQNSVASSSEQGFMTKGMTVDDHVCTIGGVLTTSSSYAPR